MNTGLQNKEVHLVTGGAGFIGVNLCVKLLEEGHRVIVVDNMLSAYQPNLYTLNKYPNYRFVHGDVTDPSFADNIKEDIHIIWHLACPASPPVYQTYPTHTMMICVVGTANVLNLAVKHKAKVLFTSTSEVYGDPLVHPQPEEYRGNVNPNGIRSCYDEGKRAAESLCFDYMRKYSWLDVRVVRLFNTYGPGMSPNDGRAVSNFITQALHDAPLTVYGDGSQTRSLCYVDDTVDALCLVMRDDTNLGVVNIGNPVEITMLELAKQVLSATGNKSRIELCDLPQDDPIKRCPDISKIKLHLHWQPKITLHEGLTKTVLWFDNQL